MGCPRLVVLLAGSALLASILTPFGAAQTDLAELPVLEDATPVGASQDWLLDRDGTRAGAFRSADGRELILDNGLVRRVWRLAPNAACVAFDNLSNDVSMLRAVRPEARLVLDGEPLDVGGLVGQPNHAYLLDAWLDEMESDPAAMTFTGFAVVGAIEERFPWKRTRHHAPGAAWPPPGVHVRLDFGLPSTRPGLVVSVHYELYDGLPLVSKWLEVRNGTDATVEVDRMRPEWLAVVENSNHVETREGVPLPTPDALHVETDLAFGGFNHAESSRFTVHWRPDPEYHTQVNYLKRTPCLLVVEPTRGPDRLLQPGSSMESFRVFELAHDSTDRERRGLALRRMYRTIAPWVTENPLILHVVSTDPQVVKTAIDQAAECGFEMVSLSFGSGLNMEDAGEANLAKFRALAQYAAARGIHLGGYSLLSSRRIGNGQDCVPPEGEQATHGNCPALASDWGLAYFDQLYRFFSETGFLQFTHDGSYPGDFDTTPRPPLQRGLDDSQWVQWEIISDFYKWLRAEGAYLRVPDYYYLNGANECGMGYREVNWSLPRAQQVIHTRQNIFDGTWEKTPSMGWMFVPLTQYHGGGAAATIEPLSEHLDHYERMLASNLGLGVQAVYRGFRLYDTAEVREAVVRWVDWYKRHRDILESDVIHGRRADGRSLDWMLHVNPDLDVKGMLVVYNPLRETARRTLRVPLYYTGLHGTVRLQRGTGPGPAGPEETHRLDWDRSLRLEVEVPAEGMAWAVLR